jgi:transposase
MPGDERLHRDAFRLPKPIIRDWAKVLARLIDGEAKGLVPKQQSSGGKDRLGSISQQGDRYLRGLFTAGALAVIRYAKIHGTDRSHLGGAGALSQRR